MSAALVLRDLSIGYGSPRNPHVVASGINLALRAGELVCLLGPNGAGKSTLLRTAAGMQRPLAGEVLLANRNLHAMSKTDLARQLGVVLTERITIGMLTAYDVVALGRVPYTGWSGTLRPQDHKVIEQSIRMVGAAPLAQRYIGELSDGERQKVMLARALAQEPQLLILDEITAFLDLPRRVEIMQILRDLAHRHSRAILLSTHDLELALATADQVWLMGSGRRVHAGAPEDLVLGGVFGDVFASEGVHFDEEAGSFRTRSHPNAEIGLSGDGTHARWTRRALERAGYRVLSEHAQFTVRVAAIDGRPQWQVGSVTCDSIGNLLATLARQTVRSMEI